MILQFKNISKTYQSGIIKKRKLKALNNVSFDLKKGKTIGIIGESGSGKSTIAKIVLNLIKADSGEVLFMSKNIDDYKGVNLKKLKKDIQIVFQHPATSLNPHMTVKDNLLEPLKIHKIDTDWQLTISKNLEMVRIKNDFLNRFPNELSGGEIQRVIIARALSLNTKLLILDEPTSMLDAFTQYNIMNLLLDIQLQTGISYMYITHDLSIASYFTDSILVLKDGNVMSYGDTEKVLTKPKSNYTKELIDTFSFLENLI